MNLKSITIMIVLLIGINFTLSAQQVSLNVKDVTIKDVFESLKSQYGYSFIFESRDLDAGKKISINQSNTKIETIVDKILEGQNLGYTISGKNIVIKKTPDVQSQSAVIRGTVTDVDGLPIPGVNVMIKGTRDGMTTDFNGRYSLSVPANYKTLIFSFIGFQSQEITIGSSTEINVVMIEDTKELGEVVVVGYLAQKKAHLTGAISHMRVSETLETLPTTSAANIMAGKLSGVNVSTPTGVPGNNPSLEIRTRASWNRSNIIFVIDGAVKSSTDFNNLSPNEIDDITILKDAASAAIYGSRSSGGVILVTTKRGSIGKPVFKYSYSFGVDTRNGNQALTSAVQTGELYNRINPNSDPASWKWSQEELDHYKTINNGWGYDQLDDVWRNPSTQTHNLSVSGGSEKVRYFGGVSYVKQEGFLDPVFYDKLNFRLNTTVDATKNLQFFVGMALSNNARGQVTWEGTEAQYRKLLVWQPDQPVFTDGGQLIDYGWIANVGGETSGQGGYNKFKYLIPQLNFSVTYNMPFIKGLSAKAAVATDWSYTRQAEFRKNYNMAIMKREGVNGHIIHTDDASITGYKRSSHNSNDNLQKTVSWDNNYQINFQLSYDRTFNDLHSVQGTLVYEKSENNSASVNGGRERFPLYLTDQFWAASSTRADTWGGGNTDRTTGRISYIGQFNYSYANKYLASFSFREDGSMNFPPDERWGFFPAASVGWVISEEGFFNKSAIDFLKIRASFGLTGNDAIGGWQWQESYQSGTSAYFGNGPSRSVGLRYGSIVNPALTWEKTKSFNFGFDMNFLKNWNTTVEYYYSNTYDILDKRIQSLPTTQSRGMPDENYGEVESQGIDFNLGYSNRSGDFSYSANLTLSYGWNKVITRDYAANAREIDIPEGKSLSYIKGYRFDKILKTQAELDQFVNERPDYRIGGRSPELGMMVFKDLSGPNGVPDNIIDSHDEDILYANNYPLVYGLSLGGSWKGFSLDLMLNGKFHERKSFIDLADGVEWNRMWLEWYDNSWTPDNQTAWLPKRISTNDTRTYNRTTDFWYKQVNFVRLKYATLSYTLPDQITKNIFDRVRLYFTGQNLFTLGNFSYYDPEMGNGTVYPIMRSYNFGVNITF